MIFWIKIVDIFWNMLYNKVHIEGGELLRSNLFFKKRTQTTQKNSQDEQPKEYFFEKRICNILISEMHSSAGIQKRSRLLFFLLNQPWGHKLTLPPISEFVLKKMFQRNTSKFSITLGFVYGKFWRAVHLTQTLKLGGVLNCWPVKGRKVTHVT